MRFLTPTKGMKNQAYEKWLVFKKFTEYMRIFQYFGAGAQNG